MSFCLQYQEQLWNLYVLQYKLEYKYTPDIWDIWQDLDRRKCDYHKLELSTNDGMHLWNWHLVLSLIELVCNWMVFWNLALSIEVSCKKRLNWGWKRVFMGKVIFWQLTITADSPNICKIVCKYKHSSKHLSNQHKTIFWRVAQLANVLVSRNFRWFVVVLERLETSRMRQKSWTPCWILCGNFLRKKIFFRLRQYRWQGFGHFCERHLLTNVATILLIFCWIFSRFWHYIFGFATSHNLMELDWNLSNEIYFWLILFQNRKTLREKRNELITRYLVFKCLDVKKIDEKWIF